jgi:fibronectin type 3 domain-containing protein
MKKIIIAAAALLMAAVTLFADYPAPKNLAVSMVSGGLYLSWDADTNTNTVSYNIFSSQSNTGPFSLVGNVAGATSWTNIISVPPSVPYFFEVQAVDTAGNTSNISGIVNAAPYPPSTVSATPLNAKVLLAWSSVTDVQVTEYNVYRSSGYGFSFISNVKFPELLDPGLINGVTYAYRIASLSSVTGALSTTVTAVPFEAPYAPSGFSGTAVAGNSINLSWTSSGDGTYATSGFIIYRSKIQNDETGTAVLTTSTVRAYSDTVFLENNTLYYYRIHSFDMAGNTSPATVTSVYYPSTSPAVPQGLTVTSYNSVRVNLAWTPNDPADNVTGYNVFRNSVFLVSASGPSYSDTPLIPGQNYSYSVQAYNLTAATGNISPAVTVTASAAPPGNVTAVDGTLPATVLLNWQNNDAEENISNYNVFRAATPSSFDTANPVAVTPSSPYIDSGVTAGNIYYYEVAAWTTSPVTRFSVTVSAMPVSTAPQPQNVTFTAGSNYVSLSWAPASAAYAVTQYNIYRSTDAGADYARITSTAAVSYNDVLLTDGQSYSYLVSCVNFYGEGASSLTVTAVPSAGGVTGVPQNVTLTSTGDGTLTIGWNPSLSADVTGYNVYRSVVFGTYQAVPYAKGIKTNTFIDMTVTAKTEYYYVVTSVGTTESAASAEVNGAPFIRPPSLSVNSFSLTDISGVNGAVYLQWETPSAAYTYKSTPKYDIYRGVTYSVVPATATFGYDSFTLIKQAVTGTNYIDPDSVPGVQYYYIVKVVDDMGNEDNSTAAKSIVPEVIIGAPPFIVSFASDSQVKLFWKTVLTSQYYDIYRRTAADTGYGPPIAAFVSLNNSEFTDSGLKNNITYFYTVAAANDAGEGPKSNEVSATPYQAAKLPLDAVIKYRFLNKKDVDLTWNQSSDGTYAVSGYNVLRSNDDGANYKLLTETPAAVTEYIDAATDWNNKYIYMIRVADSQGNTDSSYNLLFVGLPMPQNKIRVFSNLLDLSKGQTLKLSYLTVSSGKVKLSIHTLSGVHVRTLVDEKGHPGTDSTSPYDSGEIIWDGTNQAGVKVASGAYLIILELEGARVIEKVAVIK